MSPKERPAETADSAVSDVIETAKKEAYEQGYADGLRDGKPKPPLFEAAKSLIRKKLQRPWDGVRVEIGKLEDEYGERLPRADVDLLRAHYDRLHFQQKRESEGQKKSIVQRQSEEPAETEYEVVR